jgi:hypothetical protein
MEKKVKSLILILLSLTPIFGAVEILSFLRIEVSLDMFYIKLPKDILMAFIIFLSFIYMCRHKYPLKYFIYLMILVSFTLCCFYLGMYDFQIAIAGIRWALPFFLIFFLYGITDISLLKDITKLVSVLCILNLLLQIYEMFYMPPIYGLNIWGLSGRLPGFFVHPSAAGTFAAYSFFLFKYYMDGKKKIIFITISICSIFLSMSSTAFFLLIIIILLPIYMKSRNKIILFFFLLLGLTLTIYNLDLLTGREEGSSLVSGSTRIDILTNVISSGELVSTRFGSATNSAMTIKRWRGELDVEDIFDPDNDVFVADSLYTSVLTNYGYIFFIFFIYFLAFIFISAYNISLTKRRFDFFVFFIIFLLSSISIIISEIFPLSLLSAVLLSYYLKEYNVFNLKEKV